MILRIPSSVAFATLFAISALAVSPSSVDPDTPVSQLLRLASSALSAGSSQDAIAYYDIAVAKDPSNYLTLFKRGATYLSLGKPPQALSDFDKVLALKPGFEGALTQRAKIKQRTADWKGARADYLSAGKASDGEELTALDEAEGAVQLAKDARKQRDWEACVQHAGVALSVASASLELRQMRARCRLEKGEVTEAVGDLQFVLQLNPGAIEPAIQISALTFFSMGEVDKGLTAVRKCLQLDPDSKPCSKLFKQEKKIDKALKKIKGFIEKRSYSSAVQLLVTSGTGDQQTQGLIDQVKEDAKEYRATSTLHPKAPEELLTHVLELACDGYLQMNNHKRAAPYCNDLLGHKPNALPGLLHKAQSLVDADDFEGAIRTLKTAQEEHPQAPQQAQRKIQEMLQNAQTLLKRSKTKDYYKVLELPRDATDKDIRKAYRKLSKVYHPDKAASPEARPAAEKKMGAINEAYEVLKDPELKARFDSGEDPNDPEAQRGGPFGGGGNPFGGGQQFFFQQPGRGGGQQFFFQQSGGQGGQRRQGGMPFGGGFQFPGGGFPFP